MSQKSQIAALKRAVDLTSGQSALAKALAERTNKPVRQGHIWAWLNRSKEVPAEYVLHIEAVSGVSRHDLRPDIYPREKRA